MLISCIYETCQSVAVGVDRLALHAVLPRRPLKGDLFKTQVSTKRTCGRSAWLRPLYDILAPTLLSIKLDIPDLISIKIGDMTKNETDAFARAGERVVVRTLLARLRAQRLRRNWTQAEIARRAGISVQSYQNFETGYGNITLANLLRILGILGLANRLSLLVPELEEERTLHDVSRPARQRARAKKPSTRK
jgi:DNA-binding XRE family transcriptional regulator